MHLIANAFAGQGSHLMESHFAVAREQELERLDGLTLKANTAILKLAKELGFSVEACEDEPDFRVIQKRWTG